MRRPYSTALSGMILCGLSPLTFPATRGHTRGHMPGLTPGLTLGLLALLTLGGCGNDLPPKDSGTMQDAGADAAVVNPDGGTCPGGQPCELGACAMGTVSCSLGRPVCVASEIAERGVVCRPSSGSCDVEESCDGEASECPEDTFSPVGTECGDAEICNGVGACVDGSEGEPCFTGNPCFLGVVDSSSGSPVCRPTEPAGVDVLCRVSRSDCDPEELCDGAGACRTDVIMPEGTECEGGTCDSRGLCGS